MTPELLLKHFDRISEAPGAIPRLRRFILDLAVRGKLVEQNPEDEPAGELLKRIRAEKARLVREGTIKKDQPAAPIRANELPFDLPKQWAWVRLGSIIHLVSGQHLQPGEYSDEEQAGIPYITGPSDFGENGLLITRYALIQKAVAYKGQLLLTVKGSGVGKTAVCDLPEVAISRQLMVFTAIEWSSQFLSIITHLLSETLRLRARSLIPGIAREDVEEFVFAIPPLAEQHRIVAKVDELMALCDRLEAARNEREARRGRLVAASLQRIGTATADKAKDAARFHLDHLPRLTTRPEHVKQLRRTILNLAVRGRLVSQDPKDEPAGELLKQIEKAAGLKSKGTFKSDSWPYDLPKGWIWTRLAKLVINSDAGWSPKTESHPRSGNEWGILKVSAVSWDKFRAWENKQVLPGTEPRLQAQVNRGDFLISRANTLELIARAVIVDEDPTNLMMSDKIIRLHLAKSCDHRFVWVVNNHADFAREHYIRHASGVSPSMKNVSRDVIMNLPFPLPPLAEQHRIVAKVDELMNLCDQLEAQLTATEADGRRLLEAVLRDALA
jgi:type I restriction enzyme S subunit